MKGKLDADECEDGKPRMETKKVSHGWTKLNADKRWIVLCETGLFRPSCGRLRTEISWALAGLHVPFDSFSLTPSPYLALSLSIRIHSWLKSQLLRDHHLTSESFPVPEFSCFHLGLSLVNPDLVPLQTWLILHFLRLYHLSSLSVA